MNEKRLTPLKELLLQTRVKILEEKFKALCIMLAEAEVKKWRFNK